MQSCKWCGRRIRNCNSNRICIGCQETKWCRCGRTKYVCFLQGCCRKKKKNYRCKKCKICAKRLSPKNKCGYCKSCFARYLRVVSKTWQAKTKNRTAEDLKTELPPAVIRLMDLDHEFGWVSFMEWSNGNTEDKSAQRTWKRIRENLKAIDAIDERVDEDRRIWVRIKDHRGH